MSAIAVSAEQRVVLHNVSWETYGRILADQDLGGTAWRRLLRAWAHEHFVKTAGLDDGLDKGRQ